MLPRLIPEIKKILYLTDLSKNARYAFAYAATLAARFGAGITILHVLEDISPHGDSIVMNIIGEEKWKQLKESGGNQAVDTIKQRLAKFCEDTSRDLPECPFVTDDIIVKIGNPVDKIMKQVKETDPDLVVMGAHGHGIIEDAMLGSVSRRVLRRCRKPVLVVRLPEEE